MFEVADDLSSYGEIISSALCFSECFDIDDICSKCTVCGRNEELSAAKLFDLLN